MTIAVGMGFGAMGGGPMGFDDVPLTPSVQPLATPIEPTPSNAYYWNAATRGFVMNADGTFQGIHPIDQMVEMLLTVERGSVPALGQVGQRYRKRLLGVPKNKAYAVAMDETQGTLATLISAGDVSLLGVSVTFPSNTGGWVISVNYVNNRLPATGPRNALKVSVTP